MLNIPHYDVFVNRHNGPSDLDVSKMLNDLNLSSLDELIDNTVPVTILLDKELELEKEMSETEFLKHFKEISSKNLIFKNYIGLGYHPNWTPTVILRNVLENPGWYTQYTPYQAEISQGRLEALINFQTMVIDLTGLEISNASLLDEATAAAEGMSLIYASKVSAKKEAKKFFVDSKTFIQTIDVLNTRATPIGIEIVIGDYNSFDFDNSFFGALVQYPNSDGNVVDYSDFISKSNENNIPVIVAADLLSLTLLKSPGEMGADIAVGTTQRFGVPMGFGGPHAAFFATKDKYKRIIPGRIIGYTIDSNGKSALRMALQTREQHIKREKATSNICTAQVLLAVMAGMYAVYHGPKGLKNIAEMINKHTSLLSKSLLSLGFKLTNEYYFDTIKIELDSTQNEKLRVLSENKKINLRFETKFVGISINEVTTSADIYELIELFEELSGKKSANNFSEDELININPNLIRTSPYLTHPTFNKYHSETDILRYLKMLENKDLSLTGSMIPLGSCTMKLNATTEMIGVTFPEVGSMHPFAPSNQTLGYKELITELEKDLCEITGFAAMSLQPNSGAQGEYAGLLVIRAYHQHNGNSHRNICVIPASAHGTNPASAVMAGMKVVVVKTDASGKIDFNDLKEKVEANSNNLAALMVTYPSTYGVFEEKILEITDLIHQHGGQVYMDGANMNAQVGITSPAKIGADVCHLNLHKTFCIPHGGGGPGVGPIGVVKHLAQFLPGHKLVKTGGENAITAITAAPWGSASILVISYAYIKMMGSYGLKKATQIAILNANYIKEKLKDHYKVLYTNEREMVAHELIFDMNGFRLSAGIEVVDIAKRLMDYGFHAPTVSFPVAGTLMVEPTESEPLAEMDRFIEAMIGIREEIREIELGITERGNNVLTNSPHIAEIVISDNWDKKYLREKAVFPYSYSKKTKFWPTVSRVNDAYGDRNLVCSCNPIEDYIEN